MDESRVSRAAELIIGDYRTELVLTTMIVHYQNVLDDMKGDSSFEAKIVRRVIQKAKERLKEIDGRD